MGTRGAWRREWGPPIANPDYDNSSIDFLEHLQHQLLSLSVIDCRLIDRLIDNGILITQIDV